MTFWFSGLPPSFSALGGQVTDVGCVTIGAVVSYSGAMRVSVIIVDDIHSDSADNLIAQL